MTAMIKQLLSSNTLAVRKEEVAREYAAAIQLKEDYKQEEAYREALKYYAKQLKAFRKTAPKK